MAGLYSGDFVGYRRTSADERDAALREAVVAIDANVLLDLYRYRQRTSEDLLATLEALGDRLVIPHQALREFWRHRSRDQGSSRGATRVAIDAIEKSGRSLADALNVWAKAVGVSSEEVTALASRVETLISTLTSELDDAAPAPDNIVDTILERLEVLLEGRVTEPLEQAEQAECLEEARRRIDAEIPPGFKDAAKEASDNEDGGAGDYLVWYQSTRHAMALNRDLLIVTRDEKEDWWWRQRSEFLGPRPELTTEFHLLTGHRLYLMRPSDLLARAPEVLMVDVDEASSEDASRVAEVHEAPAVEWTREGIAALLARLEIEAPVQAAALRLAAQSDQGRVTREQVYSLGDYPDDRTLRGFTRPFRRLTTVLQDDGLVPEGVRSVFVARYPDGVTTSYFSVPPEVPGILNELAGLAESTSQ